MVPIAAVNICVSDLVQMRVSPEYSVRIVVDRDGIRPAEILVDDLLEHRAVHSDSGDERRQRPVSHETIAFLWIAGQCSRLSEAVAQKSQTSRTGQFANSQSPLLPIQVVHFPEIESQPNFAQWNCSLIPLPADPIDSNSLYSIDIVSEHFFGLRRSVRVRVHPGHAQQTLLADVREIQHLLRPVEIQ